MKNHHPWPIYNLRVAVCYLYESKGASSWQLKQLNLTAVYRRGKRSGSFLQKSAKVRSYHFIAGTYGPNRHQSEQLPVNLNGLQLCITRKKNPH